MIGTPFFGGHVVRWTQYFRGTSLTLVPLFFTSKVYVVISIFLLDTVFTTNHFSSILWLLQVTKILESVRIALNTH